MNWNRKKFIPGLAHDNAWLQELLRCIHQMTCSPAKIDIGHTRQTHRARDADLPDIAILPEPYCLQTNAVPATKTTLSPRPDLRPVATNNTRYSRYCSRKFAS